MLLHNLLEIFFIGGKDINNKKLVKRYQCLWCDELQNHLLTLDMDMVSDYLDKIDKLRSYVANGLLAYNELKSISIKIDFDYHIFDDNLTKIESKRSHTQDYYVGLIFVLIFVLIFIGVIFSYTGRSVEWYYSNILVSLGNVFLVFFIPFLFVFCIIAWCITDTSKGKEKKKPKTLEDILLKSLDIF